MAIDRNGDRRPRLQVGERAAEIYHLTRVEAREIIDHHVSTVRAGWNDAGDRVGRDESARLRGGGGAILNQSIFYED